MKYLTPNEIAKVWGISGQRVRKLCTDGRIYTAIFNNNTWLIPEGTSKPSPVETTRIEEISPFLKKIRYQQNKNNHFGIYEYLKVNATYSSCRMASNRLKREQVTSIYRTNRIDAGFEAVKIDDILEALNHLEAMDFIIETAMEPLTPEYIKKLHYLLTFGTYADRKRYFGCGSFRMVPSKVRADTSPAPGRISQKIGILIQDYEKKHADLQHILAFHVRFEYIRPFDDYNGRVGRLIMVKECLRNNIDPFIIDDKHRSDYFRGIALWDEDPTILTTVALQAQQRFQNQMDTCRLMQYNRPVNPRRLR